MNSYRAQKVHKKRGISVHTDLLRYLYAGIIVVMLLAVPVFISQISDPNFNTDTRSAAEVTQSGMIQSWVVSPNGGEVVYGNTEVEFFAKDSNDPEATFSFSMDLLRGETIVKNLFAISATQSISDRDGIRRKYVDFTGLPESANYRLRLTTRDHSGKNKLIDYSDNFFTISRNNNKPVFVSKPPKVNLVIGEAFSYTIQVQDSTGFRLLAPNLPTWLKLQGNKLSGSTGTPGVYPVTIIAVNNDGRQNNQIFSLNIQQPRNDPDSDTVTPTSTPQPTGDGGDSDGESDAEQSDDITITLPSGDQLTRDNATIISELPEDKKNALKNIIVEISRNGTVFSTIYEGRETEFQLDISEYEGGEYYLRFTYEYADGTKEIKNYGPVEIIMQDEDQDEELSLEIISLEPGDGQKITNSKPSISAEFTKPVNDEIDLDTFQLELDGNNLSNSSNVIVSETGFSYIPDADLSKSTHEVIVSIGATSGNEVTRKWTFEIVENTDLDEESEGVVNRNRIILIAVIIIIILIFLLSIWALTLSKRDKKYEYYVDESQESPLRQR